VARSASVRSESGAAAVDRRRTGADGGMTRRCLLGVRARGWPLPPRPRFFGYGVFVTLLLLHGKTHTSSHQQSECNLNILREGVILCSSRLGQW
jgi:hypothetical protein